MLVVRTLRPRWVTEPVTDNPDSSPVRYPTHSKVPKLEQAGVIAVRTVGG